MARAVESSADFERIVSLPVRHVTEETAARANAFMTPLLTTAKGKAAGAHLIGWQGTVLEELSELDGGYSQMGVGEGKTLITYCGPEVTESENSILIVPAKLREKTWIEFQRYAQHWRCRKPAKVMAYHDFYDRDDVDLFEQIRPDFVMLDEVQHARKQDGSFTKRLDRWVVKSNCKVWCGTGTGTRFSIMDHSHMLIWGLNDGAPVPLDYPELETWAAALDEKRKWSMGVRPKRVTVGVLLQLDKACRKPAPFHVTEQGAARVAYRNRLHATPGVIISLEDSCKVPLSIELVSAPEDHELNAHFEIFRLESAMPNGDVIPDPPVLYTKEKQLGSGFHMVWDPPPPDKWRDARRECAKFVIKAIARTAHLGYVHRPAGHLPKCICKECKRLRPLDTPGAVFEAYPDHPIVRAWLDIAPSYIENTKAEWLSASVIHYAVNWSRRTGGIVWTEFVEMGEAIAKAARIPYYGEDGRNAQGQSIENDRGGHAIVASIGANSEGRNLQGGFPGAANAAGWHDNLSIGVTQSAERLEQLIGRTHRRWQVNPVSFQFLMTSGLSMQSWLTANKEARFVQETQGQAQKILRAKTTIGAFPSTADRWRVKALHAANEKAAKVAAPSKGFGKVKQA
jgi:hypothetical protein